ncbi:uncharacterized protein JCM10292_000481 [Rhodotorula paludigena]|uniref:uncharacterized protein n=1 Tax=Rhodotorula paludigena TaxID=86838 RepID=UPI003178F437
MIPALPLDVVRLVFDFLANGLDESIRRAEGARLALVQRAWQEPAYELAWREVTIATVRNTGLRDHLLSHRNLLDYLRKLETPKVEGPPPALISLPERLRDLELVQDYLMSPEEARPIRDLVLACPNLLSLELPVSFPRFGLIDELSQTLVASKLRSLDITLFPMRHFNLVNLHVVLARFTGLDYLQLRPIDYGASSWSYNPQDRMPQLVVATLVITLTLLRQNVYVGVFSRMVIALIARSSFRSLMLQNYAGNNTLPNWLPNCGNLVDLTLWCTSPSDLCRLLLPITQLLPKLCSLQTLLISSQPLYCQLANLPLAAFLHSLPSSIRHATVYAIAFVPDGVLAVSLADLQPSLDFPAEATVHVVLAELAGLAGTWHSKHAELRKSDKSAVGWVIVEP